MLTSVNRRIEVGRVFTYFEGPQQKHRDSRASAPDSGGPSSGLGRLRLRLSLRFIEIVKDGSTRLRVHRQGLLPVALRRAARAGDATNTTTAAESEPVPNAAPAPPRLLKRAVFRQLPVLVGLAGA